MNAEDGEPANGKDTRRADGIVIITATETHRPSRRHIVDALNSIPSSLTVDQTLAHPVVIHGQHDPDRGDDDHDQHVGRQDESISSPTPPPPAAAKPSQPSLFDAMISYCWKDKDVVRLLVDKLTAAGFTIWIDVRSMADDITESIVDGIHQSAVVVAFLSDAYVASRCCKQEIKFANDLQKPILPVRLAHSEAVRLSAAAFITAGLLYIDLQGGVSPTSHELIAQRLEKLSRPTAPLDAIAVSSADVVVDESLIVGDGSFAVVYKGWYLQHTPVAVKSLKQLKLSDQSKNELFNEARVLQNCRHPHIIGFHGLLEKNSSFSLVLEFATLGSLFDFYKDPINKNLATDVRVGLLHQVSLGMAYLHDRLKTIHNDLKSLNILLTRHLDNGPITAKITDFGLSRIRVETAAKSSSSLQGGSLLWMAPELRAVRPKITKANDVYSFGVLLTEVVSWVGPFGKAWHQLNDNWVTWFVAELKSPALHSGILEQVCADVFAALDNDLRGELADLFRRCCSLEYDRRPSFRDVAALLKRVIAVTQVPEALPSSAKPKAYVAPRIIPPRVDSIKALRHAQSGSPTQVAGSPARGMVLIGEANRVVATKKIVLIGDENCGKTCLVSTFAHGQFNPTAETIETVPLKVDDYLQVQLKIIAAKGGEEYARLRPLNYPDTDVVILCFDIGDPDTLDNVEHRWISEVKHYMAAPILLVGCKLDLRNDPETLAMLARRRSQPVTFEEGTAMATKIGAHAFLECSARDGIGHRAIFELAARVALSLDRSRRERSSSSSTGRLNRSFSRKGF